MDLNSVDLYINTPEQTGIGEIRTKPKIEQIDDGSIFKSGACIFLNLDKKQCTTVRTIDA